MRMFTRKKVPILLFSLLWLMVSCDLANSINPTSEQTAVPQNTPDSQTNDTAVATSESSVEATPDIAIPTAAVTQTRPSLRVWIPPEIALATEEGAAILNAQLAAYRINHPDLDITVEQKSVSGQSGILNYLRSGRVVAPDILPDLIAIPIDQLGPALTEELIYPIDGLIETALFEDLYPAALELVLKDSQLSGYPFVLTGLSHLAYNTQAVTETIPTRWEPLTQLPNSFVFPASGDAGGTLALQFYLEAGGTLTNEAGQVALQVEPLVSALQQLLNAKNSGFILDQSSNYTSLQESWQLFQAGSADFTLTTSEQFLQERDENGLFMVTAVPGRQRALVPLTSGWAWAVSTADPAQRALVGELLASFTASDQLGEWSEASNFLPASQTALTFWSQDDPYIIFAGEQLNQADAMPFSQNSSIMTAMSNAVFDVVTSGKTPQIAAEEAVATILQP